METRKFTEGAMMLALISLLLLFNRISAGILDVFVCFFICFPVLIYTVKYGMKAGVLLIISATVVSSFISPFTTLFYIFTYLVCGFLYGIGVHYRWKNRYLIIYTCLLTFLSSLLTTVIFASIFGYDIQEDIQFVLQLTSSFTTIDTQPSMPVIQIIIILLTLCISFIETLCIHILAIIILDRLSLPRRKMSNILNIRIPKSAIYLIISIWLLYSMQNVLELRQGMKDCIFILYMASSIIMGIYGIMVLIFVSILLRSRIGIFCAWLCMLVPMLWGIVAWFGIMDGLLDFRRKVEYIRRRGV